MAIIFFKITFWTLYIKNSYKKKLIFIIINIYIIKTMSAALTITTFSSKGKIADMLKHISSVMIGKFETIYRAEILKGQNNNKPEDVAAELQLIYKNKTILCNCDAFEASDLPPIKEVGFGPFIALLMINYVRQVPEVVAYVDRVYNSVAWKYQEADRIVSINKYKFTVQINEKILLALNSLNEALEAEKIEKLSEQTHLGLFHNVVIVALNDYMCTYAFDKGTTFSLKGNVAQNLLLSKCNSAAELAVLSAILKSVSVTTVKKAAAGKGAKPKGKPVETPAIVPDAAFDDVNFEEQEYL